MILLKLCLLVLLLINFAVALFYKFNIKFRNAVKTELVNKLELSDYMDKQFPDNYLMHTGLPLIVFLLILIL